MREESELCSQHLTQAHEPELAACIARTKIGQASWAGWKAPRGACGDCVFFVPNERRARHQELKGRCAKFTQLKQGTLGAKFAASTRACQYFEKKGARHG